MSSEVVPVITDFDIFATRPVHISTIDTTETTYNPIALMDQSDLEFSLPADDTYIDLNIHLYIRCKLTKADVA
jgi:hypothetical protein